MTAPHAYMLSEAGVRMKFRSVVQLLIVHGKEVYDQFINPKVYDRKPE